VFIEGQLQTRKWQDQQGNDKYTTEVVLQGFNCQLIMLGERPQGDAQPLASATSPREQARQYSSQSMNDEIPF
jgi:single-strand DNA-binding protein